jgi:hypothetical protein
MKTTEKSAGLFNYILFRILRPKLDTFMGIGTLFLGIDSFGGADFAVEL